MIEGAQGVPLSRRMAGLAGPFCLRTDSMRIFVTVAAEIMRNCAFWRTPFVTLLAAHVLVAKLRRSRFGLRLSQAAV
jgi:hypothetical protein